MKTQKRTQNKNVFLMLLTFFFLVITITCMAQPVAINTIGASADASAIFDVNSSRKGVLIPRLTTLERDGINTPAEGLLIYNSDTQCFEYHNSLTWQTLGNCATGTPQAPGVNTETGGVAINETGNTPHGSAALDVSATDKGVLIPRMSTSERDLINLPVQGLIIYNTDTKRFEFREDNLWQSL